MIRVGQNYLHKHVVMGREVEAGDVEAEEREHPPAERRSGSNQPAVRNGGKTTRGRRDWMSSRLIDFSDTEM